MTVVDLKELQPMTPEEAADFDKATGVAKKTDSGVIVAPAGSQIAVADEGPETRLQTTEIELLDVALPFIKQGVPESIVRGLIEFAKSAINDGKDAGVVLDSLESALELIKGLLPDSETSRPKEVPPTPEEKQPNIRNRISSASQYSAGLRTRTFQPAQKAA